MIPAFERVLFGDEIQEPNGFAEAKRKDQNQDCSCEQP
jgi:hypothetical protein